MLALAVRLVVQQARQELAVQPWADQLRAGRAQAAQAAVARVRRVPAAGRVLVGRMLVDQGQVGQGAVAWARRVLVDRVLVVPVRGLRWLTGLGLAARA